MAENNKKFVIQKHTRSDDIHWDLMFEAGNVLETYRLPVPPEKMSNNPVEAVKIFDHPVKFLTYEGSVNKGQGSVKIADSGIYKILNKTDVQIEFQFDGKILKGKFTLMFIEEDHWELRAE
jgi:bifunctional non-homologous end joining protein LigD